jgi:hypothetical protein
MQWRSVDVVALCTDGHTIESHMDQIFVLLLATVNISQDTITVWGIFIVIIMLKFGRTLYKLRLHKIC